MINPDRPVGRRLHVPGQGFLQIMHQFFVLALLMRVDTAAPAASSKTVRASFSSAVTISCGKPFAGICRVIRAYAGLSD